MQNEDEQRDSVLLVFAINQGPERHEHGRSNGQAGNARDVPTPAFRQWFI
uniref:Uncharacterized protein n=1 Tax=Hyaloperonospora arabidopsidis (strain Emoy2) TaxID=559515 RepID=M4BLM6_HYAAE